MEGPSWIPGPGGIVVGPPDGEDAGRPHRPGARFDIGPSRYGPDLGARRSQEVHETRLDRGPGARFAGAVTEIPLNRRIVWVALRPDATRAELETSFREARSFGCQVVAVTGARVEVAVASLAESPVKVAALVGFPFGASDSDAKRYEAEVAVDAGAQEIQCVANMGWLREGQMKPLVRELRDVREAADERPVTAIFEWGMLDADAKRRAVQATLEAEIQFLATGTGCAARKATPDEIEELREWAGPELGLTAVGGVQTVSDALALVAAGANRVGVFALGPLIGEGN